MASIAYLLVHPRPPYQAINQLDKWLRTHISEKLQDRLGHDRCTLFSACLLQIILSLSDQQLVFGLAALITSLYLYSQTRITVYHFSIAQNLAYMSSNTHLLSLLVLRDFFSSSGKAKAAGNVPVAHDPFRGRRRIEDFDEGFLNLKIWRSVCMFAFAALLIFTTTRSGSMFWYDEWSCPANCVPKNDFGGEPTRWMIFNLVMISWAYPVYLASIFGFTRRISLRIRFRIEDFHRDTLISLNDNYVFWAYVALSGLISVIWSFLASIMLDIKLQIVWFIYTTYGLIEDRRWGHSMMRAWSNEEAEKENQVGFGQMIPILLLVLPFMAMAEVYHGRSI